MTNPYHKPKGPGGGQFTSEQLSSFQSSAINSAGLSISDQDSSLQKQFDYVNSLSDIEKKTIRRYTGGDFTWMNRHLRFGNKTSENIQERIKALSKTLENSPTLAEPIILRRSVSGSPDKLNLQEGSLFSEKGFLSTTRIERTPSITGMDWTINVPTGSHALFVEWISGHLSEREVILGPSNFMIRSITQHNEKHWSVEMDLISE